MAKKINKIIRKRVRLHNLHNGLFILNRRETLEESIETQRLITKSLNTLKNYTDFSMLENLHSLALKHKLVLDIINTTNEPRHKDIRDCECAEYEEVLDLIEDNVDINTLVWMNKGEELADKVAKAFRAFRKHLSFNHLELSIHLVEITRERDMHEINRIKAYETFNAFCDEGTQKALIGNASQLFKGKAAGASIRKGLEDLSKRINKHKLNRRKL